MYQHPLLIIREFYRELSKILIDYYAITLIFPGVFLALLMEVYDNSGHIPIERKNRVGPGCTIC